MKTDEELGKKVRDHLIELGLETLTEIPKLGRAQEELSKGVASFLRHMGLDLSDPSILNTPDRVAEMYAFELCAGLNYANFPKCTTTPNGTKLTWRVTDAEGNEDPLGAQTGKTIGKVDELVMVRKIQTVSLCEHHFQPIKGFTWIGYIPSTELLGVSKFARVTNFFARRPQVQERMTEQVYAALAFILKTSDIAVHQVATHGCMRHRGVMEPDSDMVTSKMGGRFMSNPALRQEFLQHVR